MDATWTCHAGGLHAWLSDLLAPTFTVDERSSLRTGLILSMIGMLVALAGCQSPKPDCVVTPNNLVECNEAALEDRAA